MCRAIHNFTSLPKLRNHGTAKSKHTLLPATKDIGLLGGRTSPARFFTPFLHLDLRQQQWPGCPAAVTHSLRAPETWSWPLTNPKYGISSRARRIAVTVHSKRGERRKGSLYLNECLFMTCAALRTRLIFPSFLCPVFFGITFLKNNMYCFSIIKVRCFQYQK